jgi:hypothetical protein
MHLPAWWQMGAGPHPPEQPLLLEALTVVPPPIPPLLLDEEELTVVPPPMPPLLLDEEALTVVPPPVPPWLLDEEALVEELLPPVPLPLDEDDALCAVAPPEPAVEPLLELVPPAPPDPEPPGCWIPRIASQPQRAPQVVSNSTGALFPRVCMSEPP